MQLRSNGQARLNLWPQQGVEKRRERPQNKAHKGEKAELTYRSMSILSP